MPSRTTIAGPFPFEYMSIFNLTLAIVSRSFRAFFTP